MSNLTWSFYEVWNKSLDIGKPERELVKRDYSYASELGGSMIDRFLKMNAVIPTNPPNERSKRKFEAGDIWEFVVKVVLLRAGILVAYQGESIVYQYDGLIPVHGRKDFIAGGKPDYEKARVEIEQLETLGLPSFMLRAAEEIVNYFQENYPDGLKELNLELKSCGSFMFDKYERSGCANPNHKLQAFHYLKGENRTEAHVTYVCRDDARLLEVGVFNPSFVETEYRNDIEKISYYVQHNEMPPKEDFIVFDEDFGRFSANWKVAYSNYLTMLYGFESQFQFDNTFKPKVERWNRVLGRIAKGQSMTRNNLEAIDEMRLQFKDIDRIVEQAKKIKVAIEDDVAVGGNGNG